MFRLRTVRAKLTALVAFSAVVTLVCVSILSWLMHTQLLDEVDDRVPEAIRGFDLELSDDLRDLDATVDSLAERPSMPDTLERRDVAKATRAARPFHEAYPDVDIAFFDAAGKTVASVGIAAPPETADALVPGFVGLSKGARTFVRTGCEKPTAKAPPGYAVLRPVETAGVVGACMPVDARYLTNASSKLGVELAIATPGGQILETTARFPRALSAEVRSEPSFGERDGRMWALSRFSPELFKSSEGGYDVIIGLDVTDIRNVVRRHLMLAAVVLVFAAAVSIAMGTRLASVMSRALSRLNTAQKKLEQQQYVHVDAFKTGDELEDLAEGFNTMVDGLKERDKLRTTFGKYMTQSVLEHLLSGKVQLGGEMLPVTVLFSDIRSFTTISEKMNAKELVALLNEYFTEMVSIIMAEDGVVDKYIGDAIMAVFGAPVPKPDDAVRAVRAAVRMRVGLAALNERLSGRGIAPIETGIGIHTGDVVAGNIGSEARMEYTVIGDAVNLASRLETSTKELKAPVLISQSTYDLVKDAFDVRPLKEIFVKGRGAAVMTYEVLGERS